MQLDAPMAEYVLIEHCKQEEELVPPLKLYCPAGQDVGRLQLLGQLEGILMVPVLGQKE